MAKDDMRMIVYKILRYLYECNKKGVTPCFEDLCCSCRLFKIPPDYWAQIMLELIDLEYIKGFEKIATKDGVVIQILDDARITVSGVDYLEENSTMKKAQVQLGAAFEFLIASLVSALV